MKIPSTLPITAEQSRAARFQLGLTQAKVIEESQLLGFKLKQFETGRFVPDMPFLQSLRDFYQEHGVSIENAPVQGTQEKQPPAPPPGASMWRPAQRMTLYVRDDLPEADLMKIFERMDANDTRIEGIITERLETGLFSNYSEDTETKNRELFGAMAENYLLFRMLQGRSLFTSRKPATPPETLGDIVMTQ